MSFAGERLFDSTSAPSMSLAKQHDPPKLWTVPWLVSYRTDGICFFS